MTIKEDAAVLRKHADEIEAMEGFSHIAENIRKEADMMDPPELPKTLAELRGRPRYLKPISSTEMENPITRYAIKLEEYTDKLEGDFGLLMDWITEMSHSGHGVGACTKRGGEAFRMWQEYKK